MIFIILSSILVLLAQGQQQPPPNITQYFQNCWGCLSPYNPQNYSFCSSTYTCYQYISTGCEFPFSDTYSCSTLYNPYLGHMPCDMIEQTLAQNTTFNKTQTFTNVTLKVGQQCEFTLKGMGGSYVNYTVLPNSKMGVYATLNNFPTYLPEDLIAPNVTQVLPPAYLWQNYMVVSIVNYDPLNSQTVNLTILRITSRGLMIALCTWTSLYLILVFAF